MAPQVKAGQDSEIIDRIVSSSAFQGSDLLIRLLRYLAEKSREDAEKGVKEYQIATEALGRKSDFDPRLDSYVRTQVTRLRAKLLEYTLTEGVNDPFVVKIPRGAYKLIIEPGRQAHTQSSAANMVVKDTEVADTLEDVQKTLDAREEFHSNQVDSWKKWTIALAIIAVLAASLALWMTFFAHSMQFGRKQPTIDPIVAKFWKNFMSNRQGPLVAYSNNRFAQEGNSDIHTYVAGRDSPSSVLDTFTGVGEVLAVHALDQIFIPQGIAIRPSRGALLSLDDVKSSNLILVGRSFEETSVDNILTLRYFRFQPVDQGPRKGELAVRDLNPQGKSREFYLTSPGLPSIDDYAIIARVPGLNKEHKILFAAGTTTIGTEAAVEYLCHPETLSVLLDKLGKQNYEANFEAVLYVKIARGVPVKTELVAFRKYPSPEN